MKLIPYAENTVEIVLADLHPRKGLYEEVDILIEGYENQLEIRGVNGMNHFSFEIKVNEGQVTLEFHPPAQHPSVVIKVPSFPKPYDEIPF